MRRIIHCHVICTYTIVVNISLRSTKGDYIPSYSTVNNVKCTPWIIIPLYKLMLDGAKLMYSLGLGDVDKLLGVIDTIL